MRRELLNKISAIEFNLREIMEATERIRAEVNRMKAITENEANLINNFYEAFKQFENLLEVRMYIMILKSDKLINNKEAIIEREHSKHYPGGTKTFS